MSQSDPQWLDGSHRSPFDSCSPNLAADVIHLLTFMTVDSVTTARPLGFQEAQALRPETCLLFAR